HQLVEPKAHAQPQLRGVLKQGVVPRRAAALLIGGVGCGGQVAAVDGGTPGGVGNQQPVPQELGQGADIGCFSATGAGAGKLKQGLEQGLRLGIIGYAAARDMG